MIILQVFELEQILAQSTNQQRVSPVESNPECLSDVLMSLLDNHFAGLESKLMSEIQKLRPSLEDSNVSGEVEQKLEEQSKNQRLDFLHLNDKID